MPTGVAVPFMIGLTTASTAYQGNQQDRAQKRAVKRQAEAQRLATTRAVSEQRRQEMESRRLNQRRPNIASLLANEQRGALAGAGSTMLSGTSGVPADRLTLGKSSLLGST
jgi:hypothetical protein